METQKSYIERLEELEGLKLSAILQLALDALREAEQPDSPVKPMMELYHLASLDRPICFACLGGLAAIKTVGIDMRTHPARQANTIFEVAYALRYNKAGSPDLIKANWKNPDEETYTLYLLLEKLETTLDRLRLGSLVEAHNIWYGRPLHVSFFVPFESTHVNYDRYPELFYKHMEEVKARLVELDI